MIEENLTPFSVGTLTWLLRAGTYRLTVIVKAEFVLGDDGTWSVTEQQPVPESDNPPLQGSDDPAMLERASDAVAFKPRAEFLLTGTAQVPAGQDPRPAIGVGVQVGALTKSLAVFGPRTFGGQLGNTVSEPEPFTSMALTYANAYGGGGERRNPVGKGRDGQSLPNIEYMDQLIHSPADRPPPAGFGPLSPNWEPRRRMTGTYGGDYVDKYWPGFPPDFDWGYFNAAPRDQQLDGYLRGDEEVALEGMHPEQSVLRTRLPGLRIIAIREDHDGTVTRLPMNLDTLWIDADALAFHLTWRGVTDVVTFEALEIKRLGILAETVDAPELEPAAYVQRLDAMIAERDREFDEEEPPPEPEPEPEPEPPPEADEDPLPPEVATQLEELKKQFPQPELPDEPPELSAEAQAEADRVLADIAAREQDGSDEDAEAIWTRERVIAAVESGESLADADLSGLDLSSHAFGAADFRGAKLEQTDFHGSDLSGAQFAQCQMDKACLDDAVLTAVNLAAAKLVGATLRRAELSRAVLSDADLEGANLDDSVLAEAQCLATRFADATLRRVSLVQADLSDADLSGAHMDAADLAACIATRALFAGASLLDATLSSAVLESADFSDAKLAGARLSGARLAGVSAAGAQLPGADLRRADLTDADFSRADLAQALLDDVQAADADFTQANLASASLRRAQLQGTWLSSAVLNAADLQEADCTDLQLDGTRARNANFQRANVTTLRGSEGADFSGANFRQAVGQEPIFEGCTVDAADFSHAELPGANFIQASAVQANFTAADMPGARFTLADCREAVFSAANLFEGSLEAADLSRAVLDRANCYSVQFLDAKLRGASVTETNMLMTMFAP